MFDLPQFETEPEPPTRNALNSHYNALFAAYDWQPHTDYLNLAKEACWLFDDVLTGKPKRWLSMLGHSGTGKTEWAKRIKAGLKENGKRSQMWDWSVICEKYLGHGDYNVLEHLAKVPILIIDEIGKSDWKTGTAKLSHLLDQRMGKWTICISNLTQGDIAEKLDTRIASRMGRENNRIANMGKDCPDYCNLKK